MTQSPERTFVREHIAELHDDLDAWLRIPSISADPAHAEDVLANAEWLAEALRRTGFPTVDIWPTEGAPAVFADWPAADPGAPRVLVYGHHDVQPVDPLELWTTPPFEPTIRGDDLFARGASDDKGQLLFHLLGLRAHLAATGATDPAVHLMILAEGEEESGSPHFADLLRSRRDRLECDVVVVTDTGMPAADVPGVVTAMRGLSEAEVSFYGPEVDLHSGSFGGAVPNPLHALAALITALHDADGRIRLPGFYDPVLDLSDSERSRLAAAPFDEASWLREHAKSTALHGEAGYSTRDRLGARPTAEVNGMWGGYTGPGGKTIIPAEAHAKVTFRLVADQISEQVGEQFAEFVAAHTPDGIRAEVSLRGGVRPCRSDVDAPPMAALLRALGQAFDGAEVVFTREGGSGPEADLAEILSAPLLFLGVGLPGDTIHAPNERVHLPMLARGAEAAAHLWRELAGDATRPGGAAG